MEGQEHIRCAGCGYRSRNAAFFRREKAGWRRAAFCRTCEPRPTDRQLVRAVAYMGVYGAIALGLAAFGDRFMGYAQFWLFLALILPAVLIGATIHETAHLLAARAVGAVVYQIKIGGGAILWRRHFRTLSVEIGANPLQGGQVLCVFPPGRWARWKRGCILVAGGAAELTVAAILVGLMAWLNRGDDPPDLLLAALFTQAFVMTLTALSNLSPVDLVKGPLDSDGKQLWALPRLTGEDPAYHQALSTAAMVNSGRLDEAADKARSAWEADPQQGYLLGIAIHSIGVTAGPDAAVDYFLANRHRIPAGAEGPLWSFAFANAAWHMVKADRSDAKAAAVELSDKAFAATPDDPPIMATEGAVRLWAKRDPASETLIMRALPQMTSDDDKAEFCEVLARWRIADGESAGGEEFAALARHLRGNAARVRGQAEFARS